MAIFYSGLQWISREKNKENVALCLQLSSKMKLHAKADALLDLACVGDQCKVAMRVCCH